MVLSHIRYMEPQYWYLLRPLEYLTSHTHKETALNTFRYRLGSMQGHDPQGPSTQIQRGTRNRNQDPSHTCRICTCICKCIYMRVSATTPYHTIALHYIALHYSALHCITLHYTALHCITLHYTALHCITLHYTALHCNTLHCITLHIHIYICTHTHKNVGALDP